MIRTDGATQVHETNLLDEIPDGISSWLMVLYRTGCQGTVRSGFVTMRNQAVGHADSCVPLAGAGRDALQWPEEVSRQ
jgi:hypothetical protein